jgi:Tfp pilus assembly protein PilN
MRIEVNLLPAELRRVERTPLPRFLTIIIGTVLTMTTAAFAVIVNLRKVPDLRQSENALVVQIGALQKQEKEYEQLVSAIEEFTDRKSAIAEIWRKRVEWAEKLSQLCDLTPRHVGLKEIKLEETRGARSGKGAEEPGGSLVLDSISAGSDHSRLAWFRRVLRGEVAPESSKDPALGKDFFSSFMKMEPTATRLVELDDYEEKQALEFQLLLTLKADDKRMEEAVKEELKRRQTERETSGQKSPAGARRPAARTSVPAEPATEKSRETPTLDVPAGPDTPAKTVSSRENT